MTQPQDPPPTGGEAPEETWPQYVARLYGLPDYLLRAYAAPVIPGPDVPRPVGIWPLEQRAAALEEHRPPAYPIRQRILDGLDYAPCLLPALLLLGIMLTWPATFVAS